MLISLFLCLLLCFYSLASDFEIPVATDDYVIDGGGTAGLTLPYRLAVNGSFSVAVVGAGGFYQVDNGNGSVIPALGPLQGIGTDPVDIKPLIDWGFYTVPQVGANGRRMHYTQGKTLGGSSARNHMLYQRSSIGAYQTWASHVGDESFTFPNLLPYFQKSCHVTPPNATGKRYPPNGSVQVDLDDHDNDNNGPLEVSWPNWAIPIGTWAQRAIAAVGIYPSSIGFNTGFLNGSGWPPATINPINQHRCSSASAFLTRSVNLKVYHHTQATRILFNGLTAYGVTVNNSEIEFILEAKHEVIWSAGALQSPHLLMVSGVGPREEVTSKGIDVVRDLPGVGQNLQDQPFFGVSYRVGVDTMSRFNDPKYAAWAAEAYNTNATGPLASGPAYIGWGWLDRSNLSSGLRQALEQFPDDWPDLEFVIENAFDGNNTDYALSDPRDGYQYATISASLLSFFSQGNITLVSPNGAVLPSLNTDILGHPWDMEMAIAAFKQVRKIWRAMPEITIGREYFPGDYVVEDDDIERYIRATGGLLSVHVRWEKALIQWLLLMPKAVFLG